MNNHQKKFFFDQLTEDEVMKYSNGNVIEMRCSTEELKEGFERLVKELEARGYKRMASQSDNSCSFSKPEFCKAAYVGTTVNPFSFKDKVWKWTDQFALSYKCISIHEVYRGNGTANNATFRLRVNHNYAIGAPKWYTYPWNSGKTTVNEWGVEIPTTYDSVSIPHKVVTKEIRKFKPTISDKVMKKIIDEAEQLIMTLELTDPIVCEDKLASYTCV